MGRKKSSPPSKPVRIQEDVYEKAMIVAGYEKKDLNRFLSELLRPIIENLLMKHAEETLKGRGKPSKSKQPPAPG